MSKNFTVTAGKPRWGRVREAQEKFNCKAFISSFLLQIKFQNNWIFIFYSSQSRYVGTARLWNVVNKNLLNHIQNDKKRANKLFTETNTFTIQLSCWNIEGWRARKQLKSASGPAGYEGLKWSNFVLLPLLTDSLSFSMSQQMDCHRKRYAALTGICRCLRNTTWVYLCWKNTSARRSDATATQTRLSVEEKWTKKSIWLSLPEVRKLLFLDASCQSK